MKQIAFLVLVALVAEGNAQTPTGPQVLQRVQKAYDSLRQLEVDVTGEISGTRGTSKISFQRPGKMRVSGTSMFGSDYDLLVNGKATWLKAQGAWEKVESPEMGIASITGISANAGTLIPSLLFHTKWGGISHLSGVPGKVSKEKQKGQNVLRVDAKGQMPMTLWVDAKTYLLVRTQMSAMGHTITVTFGPHKVNSAIPSGRFVK